MELHAFCAAPAHIAGRSLHVCRRLARQTEDQMHDDLDADGVQIPHGFVEHGQRIAAPDARGSRFMDGLQPQLHPDGLDRAQPRQHREAVRAEAVRPRCDREGDNVLRLHCRAEQRLQPGDGAVGVRVLLKIGDVPGVSPLFAENIFCLFQLFRNGGETARREFTAAGAEGTAAEIFAAVLQKDQTVPVRARTTGRQREFINLTAEAGFEIGTQGIIIHRRSEKVPALRRALLIIYSVSSEDSEKSSIFATSPSGIGRPCMTASNCARVMFSCSSR